MATDGKRPEYYRYADLVLQHISLQRTDFSPLDGVPLYPRQLEVHVPNNGPDRCNLHCKHCQGNKVDQPMTLFDDTLLRLIRDLDGHIPLFVFSGAYVEPTLNPRLIEFVREVKSTGALFGLHTHGGELARLELNRGFVSQLCEVADPEDYITISLDSGSPESYAKTKQTDRSYFECVSRGVQLLVHRRTALSSGPRIRLTYLLNKWNSTEEEIESAASIARSLAVDSLRFSIPYAPYGTSYEATINYKKHHEVPFATEVEKRLEKVISSDASERPYISFLRPEYQDVEGCFTHHCHYGYFQITVGSDGYLYRCSSTASPTFPEHRLGRIPATAHELLARVGMNQDRSFDPLLRCKPCGARCNRAAIDVNTTFEARWFTENSGPI